MFARFA